MKRRTFFRTGLSSGVFITVFGFKRVTPSRTNHTTQSHPYHKLRRLAKEYGGEFGEVVVEIENLEQY